MEKDMDTTRREMLKLAGTGLCTVAIPGLGIGAVDNKRPGLALQLYSVRRACGKNFDKALESVAKMGFEAVEFAGYYKYKDKPTELRRRLDDLGLKVAGTHVGAGVLSDPKAIEFHQTLGCKYLIVPADGRVRDKEKSKEFAELLNQAAENLEKHGMYCGYHNHAHEFNSATEDGKTWWDLLAQRTSEDVVLQMDVGWVVHAGRDPVEYLRKYPGRTRTVHFKPAVRKGEEGKTPIIGQDSVPWKEVIAASREVGGTEWFIVEQEKYPGGKTPMESSKLSLEGLEEIIAASS